MRKPTDTEIDDLFQKVEEEMINFVLDGYRGGHSGCGERHKLIVESNGSIRNEMTVGQCRDLREHYGITPHELTIVEKTADPWYPDIGEEDNPGWNEVDGKLDLTDWCGHDITAEEANGEWRERLQRWIEEGNFRPKRRRSRS